MARVVNAPPSPPRDRLRALRAICKATLDAMEATWPRSFLRRGGAVAVALLAAMSVAAAVDQVPVLLWTSDASLWGPATSPHSGHIVTAKELHGYLKPALQMPDKNLVLFLQDKLSVDDFTHYGRADGDNAFSNIQRALASAPSSLVLPSVDWRSAGNLPAFLRDRLAAGRSVRELRLGRSPSQEPILDPTRPNLLLVNLPRTSSPDVSSPKEALERNDEIIREVTEQLNKSGFPFTAIYTASRPSRVIREIYQAAAGTGRKLMQAESSASSAPSTAAVGVGLYPPVTFRNKTSDCIFMWASRVMLRIGQVSYDATEATFSEQVDTSASSCSPDNATLSLQFSKSRTPTLPVQRLTIRFSMSNRLYPVSAERWFTLDKVAVAYANSSAGAAGAEFNVSSVYAPAIYSYRCQVVSTSPDSGARLVPVSPISAHVHVSLKDFQIQAFNVRDGKFAYASDCASFFTPAVWMGLVVGFILLLVLTYGVHMVLQLKTMDRFDDPKGPTISVPQTD
ncbi:LOW QUALITY PROTEIN: V-type proton ATPase subunit S1 [Lethenteron reissneri]|uniref:LOW QUALITY PROTEIN: V-type proton ATPase subunit S1 n=1 Tax=Lethenteron reissneri TaxID=7753 RepID=UPI002AB69867|nr:LOW QUALITY PROTEIN: V-type proton ATPase subunit S1 [Lethenteron reissneri]